MAASRLWAIRAALACMTVATAGDIISLVVSVQIDSQRPNISEGMRAACLRWTAIGLPL